MSSTFYDAQNSYLTLGMEMIEANRDLRTIIAQENTIDKIQRLEALVLYLDFRMAPYRQFMRLDYFDEKEMRMVEKGNYAEAMKYIMEKKKNAVHSIDDKLERPKYLYWVLIWSGLISSAYSKLKMVPEMSAGVDDSLMQKMGVDPGVIVEESVEKESEEDEKERVASEKGVSIEEVVNPYELEDDEDDDYELES